ncbi:MAG: DNA-3-methyladenine glycosylase 2 family protein [Acidimicrobiia bacterium]
MAELLIPLPHPVDLGLTLGVLARGPVDPCIRFGTDGVWRATRTPAGPATARYAPTRDSVLVSAWGEGARWLLDHAPDLLGCSDDDSGFVAHDAIVLDAHRRLPGLRFCRSRAVVEALVPTILEQKVTGNEAHRAYARLVRRFGEPAPGPRADMLLPPSPSTLARLPSWEYHRCGIERRRASAIALVCARAARLERLADGDPVEARRILEHLDGVGPWTAAEVTAVALGDPDTVSVGDFHLPHVVAYALTGERLGDDARMLELLEPYRGHRGRVVRLLEHAGPRRERRAPRAAIRDIARI